jgi:hypothetical protein
VFGIQGSHAGPRTFVLGAVSEPVREHLVVLAAAAGEIVLCSREFAGNRGQPPVWRLRVCYSAAAATQLNRGAGRYELPNHGA